MDAASEPEQARVAGMAASLRSVEEGVDEGIIMAVAACLCGNGFSRAQELDGIGYGDLLVSDAGAWSPAHKAFTSRVRRVVHPHRRLQPFYVVRCNQGNQGGSARIRDAEHSCMLAW